MSPVFGVCRVVCWILLPIAIHTLNEDPPNKLGVTDQDLSVFQFFFHYEVDLYDKLLEPVANEKRRTEIAEHLRQRIGISYAEYENVIALARRFAQSAELANEEASARAKTIGKERRIRELDADLRLELRRMSREIVREARSQLGKDSFDTLLAYIRHVVAKEIIVRQLK